MTKQYFCHCLYSQAVFNYKTTSAKKAALSFAEDHFIHNTEDDQPEIIWVVEAASKKRTMFAVVMDQGDWKAAEFK